MQTQNVLIVSWVQWGPGTYPLCSSLKKLCCLLLLYPHDHTDAYKASIFYGFVASPPLVGNTVISFILLSFYSYSVSTVRLFSKILNSVLPAPWCWTGIWSWWITILFSSYVLSMIPIASILFAVSGIETGNDTGSLSDVLGDSLTLCGNIMSCLNCSPRI